jgi:hemerythrin
MNLFVWTEALATGNSFLDVEHQELVRLVNAALESIASHQGEAGLDQCIQRLQHYAREHFAREEREMQQISYKYSADHRAAHTTLLEQLQEVHEGMASGQGCDPMEHYRFLTWWVKDHIRDWDMPLARALAARAQPTSSSMSAAK